MFSLTKFIKTISLVALMLACFGPLPQARAVCQEGCSTNQNTVLGDDALISNTSGNYNTAIGFDALLADTTGELNTGVGSFALLSNTGGNANTATGYKALNSNTTGLDNTATGYTALYLNKRGSNNTAIGYGVLYSSSFGSNNTAIGLEALFYNETGNDNIALGFNAGINHRNDSNDIDIGNGGVRHESNSIRIGTVGTQTATFVSGISGATVPDGVGVLVGADGHLGTVVSSQRFKDAITPMGKASEAILALKPVTFRYKHDLDPAGIPQFGLVAEDVEKVNPALVARDDQGNVYTVRYDAVNAMLLNEFLKEHRKVETLEAKVAKLEATVEKVSAQLELSKAAPRTVLSNSKMAR